MLLSWIVKTIPRSPRAFLALLVMLGSTGLLFSSIQDMFTPIGDVNKTMVMLKFVVGLVIGLPATALFYWFQSMDDSERHVQSQLEVLDHYAQPEQRKRIVNDNKAKNTFWHS